MPSARTRRTTPVPPPGLAPTMAPPKAGENRLATMLDAIDLIGLILDPDGRIVYCNDTLLTLTGWTREEVLGLDWFDSFIAPEIREELRETLFHSIRDGLTPARHTNEIVTRGGERRLIAWYNAVLRDDAGRIDSLASMGRDRTALRAAEVARQATEARLAAILGQLPGMLWTIDLNLRCTASLGAGLATLGLNPNEIVGMHLHEFARTSDPADPAIIAHHAALAGVPSKYEATIDDREYACHVEPLHDPDGSVVGAIGIAFDISEERRATAALERSEDRLRRTLEGIDAIVSFQDHAGGPVIVSPQVERILGCPPEQLTRFDAWNRLVHPDDLPGAQAAWLSPRESWAIEYRMRRSDGRWIRVSDRGRRIQHVEGDGPGLFGVVVDVTAQREADEARRIADRLLIEESADGIFRLDRDSGAVLDVNPAGSAMLGVTRDALMGGSPLGRFVRDPDGASAWSIVLEAGETAAFERAVVRPDGQSVILAVRARILPDGTVMASARDITAERELEARVFHGQRLEAIGKLAGGIAHDFNNMLAAIQGYGELALESLPADSPTREDVEQVLFAADRAAVLTRQLLAYSRRQVLAPEVLDPGEVIDRVVPMLGRLLGDGIELRIALAPGLWRIRADPGQLEQVLINLAVNARDAMPGGGVLAISAANVDPGAVRPDDPDAEACPCMRITVSDTGIGIDAAILGRIFEPFFTTKGPGKGSGMGLATVHGIVEQSGGAIRVESEPGRGTAFTIDLPRVDEPTTPTPEVIGRRTPETGSEILLLVEDEEAIRRFLERTLGQLGYAVWSAGSGDEALDLVTTRQVLPDLLVTDVQMPGMQGPELARRLRVLRPGLPVLFISGYSEELVDRADDATARVLEKPFDADSLAAAVRETLDADRAAG